jgi:hypothetical protein
MNNKLTYYKCPICKTRHQIAIDTFYRIYRWSCITLDHDKLIQTGSLRSTIKRVIQIGAIPEEENK